MALRVEIVRVSRQPRERYVESSWLVVYADPEEGVYGEIPSPTWDAAVTARDTLLAEAGR